MKPPGRIQQEGITTRHLGGNTGFQTNIDRIHVRLRCKYRYRQLPAELGQLVNRRRTINVRRNQVGLVPVITQIDRKFAGRGRFTRALESHQHDRHRPRALEIQLLMTRAHQFGELLIDDFYNLLPRRQTGQNILPQRPGLNIRNELFNNPEMHIRLQQRHAHFAEAFFDVAFR